MLTGPLVGVSVAVLLVSSMGAAKDKGEPTRVAIYLTGAPGLPDDEGARKAADKQLMAAYDAACKAAGQTTEALKAKHGKKQDQWPVEAQAERARAVAGCEVGQFDAFYRHSSQKDIDDSVADLRKRLARNDDMPAASGAEDAVLVVKVVGRSRASFKATWAPYACLGLEVSPGGKAEIEAFPDLGVGVQLSSYFGPGSRQIGAFHPYTREEPYWLVDGCGQGVPWRVAASGGEVVLGKLVDNYAKKAMVASR
jgi:hypothetical protein